MSLLGSPLASLLGGPGAVVLPPPGAVGAAVLGLDDPLGVDVKCFPNLDPAMQLESGPPVVASALVRRLTTPRGGLFYDPGYGFAVQNYLNSASADGFAIASEVEAECLKDPRVLSADVTQTFIQSTGALSLLVAVTLRNGTQFSLIINETQVTTALLNAALD